MGREGKRREAQEASGKFAIGHGEVRQGCVATDAHGVPRAVARYGNSLPVGSIAPFDSSNAKKRC